MSSPQTPRRRSGLVETFRALRHADFRLLWLGQLVSLTGTWMQSVAQGWLVLRLTDSTFYLGLVGFLGYLPLLVFALVGGVAADRFPKRAALFWTQGLAMGAAALLAVLTSTGTVEVWHIAALALFQGTLTAFDVPIRQSFLQELVGRKDLQNAIALNSMAFNTARFLGPALAGFLVAAYGEAACFAVNSATYLAVLAAVAGIRARGRPRNPGDEVGSWTGQVREGLAYAWNSPRVRAVLALIALMSVFGMPYAILLPAFARDVLGGDAQLLGWLMASSGLGALLGAVGLARRRSIRRAGRILAVAVAVFSAAILAFAFSSSVAQACASLVVAGAAMLVGLGTGNAYLQLSAPETMRGRIVSLYMMAFVGMAPVGSLLAGGLARWIGVPWTLALGALVCLAGAAAFALRIPALRRWRRRREAEAVPPGGPLPLS